MSRSNKNNKKEERWGLKEIGDRIARKNKWERLKGKAAIRRYLIDKYHWLPKDTKGLTDADLWMLLDGDPMARRPVRRRRARLSERVRYPE